jgi:hypothetical protein
MPKLGMHYDEVPLNVVLRIANVDNHTLPYPDWQEPLHHAQIETDPQRIREKVFQAEAAIFARLQELSLSSDGHVESEEISNATRELLRIKTEKLKWPLP